MLCGKGDNGKSLLMSLIKSCFPDEHYVTTLSKALDTTNNRREAQMTVHLLDNRVRIVHVNEWSEGEKDSELIKKICDGVVSSAQGTSNSRARLVITANGMRQFSDEGQALRRRMHYVALHGTPDREVIHRLGLKELGPPPDIVRRNMLRVMLECSSACMSVPPGVVTGDDLHLYGSFRDKMIIKTPLPLQQKITVDAMEKAVAAYFAPGEVDDKSVNAMMRKAKIVCRAPFYLDCKFKTSTENIVLLPPPLVRVPDGHDDIAMVLGTAAMVLDTAPVMAMDI